MTQDIYEQKLAKNARSSIDDCHLKKKKRKKLFLRRDFSKTSKNIDYDD